MAITALALILLFSAQSPKIPTMAEIPGLLAQFSSPNPGTRAKAFYKVAVIPHIFEDPSVGAAVTQLLVEENKNFDDPALWENAAVTGVIQKEFGGDGYGLYVSDLEDQVYVIAKATDNRDAILALLLSPGGPDSPCATWLATKSAVITPAVEVMAKSSIDGVRIAGVNEAGLMIRLDNKSPGSVIPPEQRGTIKAIVLNGLKDASENGTRMEAMEELAKIRDPGDEQLIEQVANSDPNSIRRATARNMIQHWGSGH